VEQCWREKEEGGWKDMYGLERMRWYENSEGGREYSEIDLIKRERDSARAEESRKIEEARYNRIYKEILAEGGIP